MAPGDRPFTRYSSLLLVPLLAALASVQPASAATSAPAAYCAHTGGTVQTRAAAQAGGARTLGGAAEFCRYARSSDGSRISVLLDTLYSVKPTLAVLAYDAKKPPGTCRANPASCYCALLGGVENVGRGWLLVDAPADALELCVFADRSAIDSFGLFYHAAGIIRGTDLARVLRYNGH